MKAWAATLLQQLCESQVSGVFPADPFANIPIGDLLWLRERLIRLQTPQL
jgi:hypothetical protein